MESTFAAALERSQEQVRWTTAAGATLAEIAARDASYLASCRVPFPAPGTAARVLRAGGVEFRFGDGIEAALEACAADLARRGIGTFHGEGLLCYAMAATHADVLAEPELFSGALPAGRELPPAQLRTTPGGCRYRVWGSGAVPLVLVNAHGVPLALWARLLADASLPLRIYVVEPAGEDAIGGGFAAVHALDALAAEVVDVLAHEDLRDAVVLGWSNGGRVAAHVAAAAPQRVSRLVLHSPTLSGLPGVEAQRTPFQETQLRMLGTAAKSLQIARGISDVLCKNSQRPTDWAALELDDASREDMLLRMPIADATALLLAPLSGGEVLLRYAQQALRDESAPLAPVLDALAARGMPTLLLTGAHDQLVSNAQSRAALQAAGIAHWEACVLGAGHYVQDLQYGWFRKLLLSFVDDELAKVCLNRVALIKR